MAATPLAPYLERTTVPGNMNPLETILANLNRAIGTGLSREPQQFLYLGRGALYEHFKAVTGLDRVPVGGSEAAGASGGVSVLGLKLGASGSTSTRFEISEPHLFESLEPILREQYPDVTTEDDVVANLRSFGWFRGSLYWLRVGPSTVKDKVVEEARLFYILETPSLTFSLGCDERAFSPFAPFLMRDPHLFHYELQVETLAYNSGVLQQYGTRVHPKAGRSLVLVPTVILLQEDRSNAELAAWLRDFNDGEISRPYGTRGRRRDADATS